MRADERFVAGMCRLVVAELLVCDAAVIAPWVVTFERLVAGVVLHVSVQVVFGAKGIILLAAGPATLVVTACVAGVDQGACVLLYVFMEGFEIKEPGVAGAKGLLVVRL